MRHRAKAIGVVLALLALGGCARTPPLDASAAPVLRLESFFVGRSTATGVFHNAFSGSDRRFSAIFDGRYDGRVLTLAEHISYEDGDRETKTWKLTPTAGGGYTGTREDVVGTAIGTHDGNAVRLSYDANFGQPGKTTLLHFDDLLTPQPDGSVVNTATVSKFGVNIGDVRIALRRGR